MKIRKSLLGVLSTAFIASTLVGCGLNVSQNEEEGKNVQVEDVDIQPGEGEVVDVIHPDEDYEVPNTEIDPVGIVEGEISVGVDINEGIYTFILKNDKESTEEFTFNSSQKFEYQIKDLEGKVIYTYSMDKSFLMSISTETLKPGEEMVMDLEMKETLEKLNLEKGLYSVEIWSKAEGFDGLRTEVELNIE